MAAFFSTDHIFFTLWGYAVSYIELIGTVSGLLCVWLAARDNILTWPAALINVTCFFLLFAQIQLYADMLLQVYFFITGVYGWIFWTRQQPASEPVYALAGKQRWWLGAVAITGTLLMGYSISRLHLWMPGTFRQPAAWPYTDSLVAVLSVIANILLARRVWENWVLWIIVDIVAVLIYFQKGVKFLALEYFILLIIAVAGCMKWLQEYRQQEHRP